MVLHKGLPIACWKCWWREGSLCYSEEITLGGVLETEPDPTFSSILIRKGRNITEEHYTLCTKCQVCLSKRVALQNIFGNIPITIASEENLKKYANKELKEHGMEILMDV